jgi:signal recognition particle subunit SRP54
MKKQLANANVDEKMLGRQEAIILSMTKKERTSPQLLHASRKKRVAGGSGTTVQEVNKLIKQWQEMNKVMKRMRKLGKKGMLPDMSGMDGDMDLSKLAGGSGDNPLGGQLPPGFPKNFKF